MIKELKRIFKDTYVLIIFFIGGFLYPAIYGTVYYKGTVDEMPIAVVDLSGSASSRRYIQKLDATREVDVAAKCVSMAEAQRLMQERKVKGVVLFPSDYDEKLANMEQSTISTYADMGSFLYYKDITMAANHVMLDEMKTIETSRYSSLGMDEASISQMIDALPTEDSVPYNTNYSFLIFFLSAAVILVVQQTMFFGVSVMNGTMIERSVDASDSTLLGRASAYWLLYQSIAAYALCLVPHLFGMPQRGSYWDMMLFIGIFVAACVAFSFTFSRFVRHRETAFVLLLFMSSVCLFLSGCAWPTSAFPKFWQLFSYIFPSTFGIQGFNNINNAGCDFIMIRPQIKGLVIQFIVYGITSYILAMTEKHRDKLFTKFI